MSLETKAKGAYHLSEMSNLYDIQRGNNFEFVVPDITNLRPASNDPADTTFSNVQETLRISVKKSFVPHFTQDTIQVKRGNSTIKYAGVPTYQAGTITFHDFIGPQTKDMLMAWQNLSYNVTEDIIGISTEYKKDCYLIEYPPDYSQAIRIYQLYGCWVSGISESDFDSESPDKKLVDCTIEYDKAQLLPTEAFTGTVTRA